MAPSIPSDHHDSSGGAAGPEAVEVLGGGWTTVGAVTTSVTVGEVSEVPVESAITRWIANVPGHVGWHWTSAAPIVQFSGRPHQ